jgi:hypothetical protein
LLAWILGSVCWIAYWGWHYGSACRLDRMGGLSGGARAITCHWTRSGEGGVTVVGQTASMGTMLRDMAITTFGLPVWAIVGGVVVYWAVLAVQRRSRPR